MLHGATIPLHPMYKFLIMIRHYGLDFHSIAGNGFSQNSVLQNEQESIGHLKLWWVEAWSGSFKICLGSIG